MSISRKRKINEKLNDFEISSFRSINSSLGWLEIAASPFCAFYSSYLQQKQPNATIETLQTQSRYLKVVQKLRTQIYYPRPSISKNVTVTLVIFSDAARANDYGQLSFIAGVLLGPLKIGSIFYIISWQSHKSRRPVKSSAAAETLAAAEAIDEGKTLKSTLTSVLQIDVPFYLVVDTKDLYTSLSTKKNSIDKSIRADVNVIRYEFETQNVNKIFWIPGSTNISDPGTKPKSSLSELLKITMATGILQIDLEKQESKSSNLPLG